VFWVQLTVTLVPARLTVGVLPVGSDDAADDALLALASVPVKYATAALASSNAPIAATVATDLREPNLLIARAIVTPP
jgi:hypothetical protein